MTRSIYDTTTASLSLLGPFFFPVNKRKFYRSPRAKRFGQEAALQAKEAVEGSYSTFFLGRGLLVWPYFSLQQLIAQGYRGCRQV